MADYYTNLSLQVRLPDEAAQTYALELHEQASRLHQGEDEPGSLPDELPVELREFTEVWSFQTEADRVEDQPGLWIHSQDGGVDAICAFLQHLLQKFDPEGAVTFEWSNDCSKPRTDAYGGGAAIVTAEEIQTMSTSAWLRENAA